MTTYLQPTPETLVLARMLNEVRGDMLFSWNGQTKSLTEWARMRPSASGLTLSMCDRSVASLLGCDQQLATTMVNRIFATNDATP